MTYSPPVSPIPRRCRGTRRLSRPGALWVWMPGRSLTPLEEQTLGEWKAAIHKPVVRCLGARDPETRMAAVACLGNLPIDDAAAPAVRYVDDPVAEVRKQTVSSFSQRSSLLTHEMLFSRLHDSDPMIREMASLVLKTRGLTQEQISLGGLIYSPKPEQRVSVIPLLKDRTDIDPVIWLIQLSRDPRRNGADQRHRGLGEAQVADGPAAAFRDGPIGSVGSGSPGGQQGCSVRQRDHGGTPPLPGSSSLNPRAN